MTDTERKEVEELAKEFKECWPILAEAKCIHYAEWMIKKGYTKRPQDNNLVPLDFQVIFDMLFDRTQYSVDSCKDIAEEICAKFGKDNSGMVPKVTGETSDGYHTFNELYDHRCLLWINYCLINPSKCYLIPNHFEGWFLLGMKTSWGQISYHLPNRFYGMVENIKIESPEFDGHTPKDVINRLECLAVYNRNFSHHPPKERKVSLEEIAKKLYEMHNYSRTFESNKPKWEEMSESNKDNSGFRWQAKRILSLLNATEEREGE